MNQISASPSPLAGLSVSVVVYHPDTVLLERTLSSLSAACAPLRAAVPEFRVELFLVDNGGLGDARALIERLARERIECRVLAGHGNVGYGRGHNLAIAQATQPLHLILNPDIDLEPGALAAASAFFAAEPGLGLLTPWIGDDAGERQYLCRRYPTLLDLLVRGFLPAGLRQRFTKRLAHYEMRDVIDDASVFWEPPIVSGCFMLFRTEVLKRLHGFDPRYFLYFEDYDLSLRAHELARVAYVPAVRVVHHGGGASRKGFAHIRMFGASAFKFFNRFGWRLW
jgi:GT2 family glycosyltransferase